MLNEFPNGENFVGDIYCKVYPIHLIHFLSNQQTIDKKINGVRQNLLDKKFALQMREERIEEDLQAMTKKPKTKQLFHVKLQTSFFDCSKCCGANIIGCYSPAGGEHCERPLEIGKRFSY